MVSSTQSIVGVQRLVTVKDRDTGPLTEVGVVVIFVLSQSALASMSVGTSPSQQTVAPAGSVTEPLLPMILQKSLKVAQEES